jgi:hypothetical protein
MYGGVGGTESPSPSGYQSTTFGRVLPFDAWLLDSKYNDVGAIDSIMSGPDVLVLYRDDPFNQIASAYVIEGPEDMSRERRIALWRERTATILEDLGRVESQRLEIEEASRAREEELRADEEARASETAAVVTVPRALSKPSMGLSRDPDYLDQYWRLYVFKDSSDASSTFYSVDSFGQFRERNPSICVSAGALIATAYRSFISDLRTPADALHIADRLVYPNVVEDGDVRYSIVPALDGRQYKHRAWAWAAGARFRDQRVELALLEHFSYLAAISWLVWNPVDKDLLKTLVDDANRHSHKVLHKALKRHYVHGDHSDRFKKAKHRIGELLHSKKHGIVAKAMRRRDKDHDGYPDGWMFGLARFVFADSEDGAVGQLDKSFYQSFTRETLRPLASAIETTTRICRRRDELDDATSSDDSDDGRDGLYDSDDDDTVRSVGQYRMIDYDGPMRRDGGNRFGEQRTAVAAIGLDDLIYRVNEVREDGDLDAMRSISGYLIDYEHPEDRSTRAERVRSLLRYDLAESILTSRFLPNTQGLMCPHLNLSRQHFYALANIAVNGDIAEQTSSQCLIAESLFFAIAHYCAQRSIDWTLVGHALPRLSDDVTERLVEIVEAQTSAEDSVAEDAGTRFVSIPELLWTKALQEVYRRCVTSAARGIVDAIYPREGIDSSDNLLLGVVADSDVYSRQSKAKGRLALFIGASIGEKSSQVADAERSHFLGAVLYDLLRRCAPFSRARVIAAIRLAQEAHSAVVRRQVSCASAFEISAADLFRSANPIDVDGNDHVSAALQLYRSAADPTEDAFESRLVTAFGVQLSDRRPEVYALRRVATLAKDGKLFTLTADDLTPGERAQCVRVLASTMAFVRSDIVKVNDDDSVLARIAILPVLVDKQSPGAFINSNISSVLRSARNIGGTQDGLSVNDVGMAIALSGTARRTNVYAAAYAAMCYMARDCDLCRRLFTLASDAASNSALRSAESTIASHLGANTKLLSACAPEIAAAPSHEEVVRVFAENDPESAYCRIITLAEATQLLKFLSKDAEYAHSRTPFIGVIKRVSKDGAVKVRVAGTHDHLSGGGAFRRTIEIDVEECRRAYNLCRALLPLLRAGVELARASSSRQQYEEYEPFVCAKDVVRASSRNRVHRVLDDGIILRGIVHRYESQADAHMAVLSANVVKDLFERVGDSQEPDSAFVVQCANLRRYAPECLDAVRHYLDYLARRWTAFEFAVALYAHRQVKESAGLALARYTQSPLARYLSNSAQNNMKNHYRFVRLLYDTVTNRYALARYAWLVPPDNDVSVLLGASPSRAQVEDLILRCCIPPSFCNPLAQGAHWNAWKQRYLMSPFSSVDHHVHHDVPKPGEFYCVKRIAPPLSDEMKARLRSSFARSFGAQTSVSAIDEVHRERQPTVTTAAASSTAASSSQNFE